MYVEGVPFGGRMAHHSTRTTTAPRQSITTHLKSFYSTWLFTAIPAHLADDVARVMDAAAGTEAGIDRRLSFDEFIHLLEQAGPAGPLEGPDPKVPAAAPSLWLYYLQN